MSAFAGFDLDRVGALRTHLKDAATDAAGLSDDVGRAVQEAHDIIVTTGGRASSTASWRWDDLRRGLSTLATSGPTLADEIGRRLAHLEACERMDHAGFRIDLDHVFDDAEPPDPATVTDALDRLRDILRRDHGLNGNTDDLQDLQEVLAGLGRDELEALVMALTDDDLARWNREASTGDGWFSDDGMTQRQVLWLGNTVMPGLSNVAVRRLIAGLPVLEPRFDDVDGDVSGTWTWWPGDLGDPPSVGDLHQGQAGDCWFLAGLAAELQADSDFLSEHLRDNGNGTYTVTFYDHGEPVQVTVSGTLPTSSSGGPLFAHPGYWQATGPSWMAIYEKAFARFKGSYGQIEGGYGEWSMEALTGHDARREKPEFDDLQAKLDAGQPMTVGTKDDSFLWWGDDDHRVDDQKLVSHHEYYVREIKQTDHGPVLVVVNPWGDGSGAPYEVELTEDEYDEWISQVSWSE